MKWWWVLGFYLGMQPALHAMDEATFDAFKQEGLDQLVLRFSDIAPLLQQHQQNPLFEFTELGHSVLGTPIYQIKLGRGDTRVLAWTQMHGDEPTATAAIFDLLKFIADDAQGMWRESWMEHLTLYIIPMLNPDGAEIYSRVNAHGIDINRDALALQSPEGRILMDAAKRIEPHYAFNLHDQNRFLAAGNSGNPATISLLAPAFNEARDINDSRRRAMQLIAYVRPMIEQEIPGHLGRYDDTFSVRSFGDTFSSFGISTVLVEAGGHRNDDHRQVARRLNFLMYVKWLNAIASGSYRQADLAEHDAIPFNQRSMKDVLIENVRLTLNEQPALLDLAFDLNWEISRSARIDDIGDLSVFGAYHRFDAAGLDFQPGRAYRLTEPLELILPHYLDLLRAGYTHFVGDKDLLRNRTALPVLLNPGRQLPTEALRRHQSPTFLLRNDDAVQYAVINGQVIELAQGRVLYRYGS